MTVIATAVGASATGIGVVGKAVIDALAAKSQRNHDAAEAKAQREAEKAEKDAQREHDRVASVRAARAQQIAQWREGLNMAALTYQKWANIYDGESGRRAAIDRGEWVPNIVGDVWFQSLRAHLPAEFRTTTSIQCDADTVVELGDAIDRVQREWAAEQSGQ